MANTSYTLLEARGVIAVGGADARDFLQGLVSNDVRRVAADRAVHAAFLTPQGKYLHDFFMVERDGAVLLDGEAARRDDLLRRLRMYRLRAKVTFDDRTDSLTVAALFGAPLGDLLAVPGAVPDPRLEAAGARVILPRAEARAILHRAGCAEAPVAAWDRLRISLGLPDGSRDLDVERALLLENGFDELHGVDFDKGCYMGQELTARTKHRALIKKRLVPVAIDGPAPAPHTPILADGRDAGEMRSSSGDLGLALMRLDHLDAPSLTAGTARIAVRKPVWAGF